MTITKGNIEGKAKRDVHRELTKQIVEDTEKLRRFEINGGRQRSMKRHQSRLTDLKVAK